MSRLRNFRPACLALATTAALAGTSALGETAPSAEPLRFPILAFAVVGNSVLSTEEIENAVYPFLGESQTLADAERARTALERAYASRGFLSVAVTLPPQAAADGEITLQVTEARIGKRRISGAQYNLPSSIAEALPTTQPGQVPDFNELQGELAQVQSRADLEITPVLAAGSAADRLDVEIKVQDRLPLHGSVELNSKQTYNGARGRLEVGMRYDNLLQQQHSIGLNWLVAPAAPHSSSVWVLSYGLPLGEGRLNAAYVHSSSSTPTSLGGATVTRGRTFGLRWRHPLPGLDGGASHAFTTSVDWKDNEDASQNVAGFTTATPALRYPAYGLSWDFFAPGSAGGSTQAEIALAFGTSAFGARTVDCNGVAKDQFDCKRAGASATFQVLRGNLATRWRVGKGWDASLRLQGQLADAPQASSEQFGAGGFDSVRGYYEYEQVGDRGWSLRTEIGSPAWTQAMPLALTAVAFADYASLRTSHTLPGEIAATRLASLGFGLRAQGSSGLQIRLDYALPLYGTVKADSAGQAIDATRAHRGRLDFSARLAM